MSRIFYFIVLIFSSAVVLSSCGDKPTPPEALVNVVIKDSTDTETAVAGVEVKLYSNPNGSYIDVSSQTLENPDSLVLEDSQVTDALGFVRFHTVYECILSVQATYVDKNKIEYKGKTILIFKEDELFEKTLVLK